MSVGWGKYTRRIGCALGLTSLVLCNPMGQAEGQAPTEDPENLEQLLDAFRHMPGLTAHFVEEKRLAILTVPVRSEGTVAFSPPGQLVRRVETPTESVALIDDGQLKLASGGSHRTVDLSGNEIVAAFVDTFRHVLSGDRSALERTYELTFVVRSGEWELRLSPRGDALRRFLRRLTLEGEGMALRRMTMIERNGDTTTTTFSDIDAQHRFTSGERARVFALPRP